MPNLSNIRQEVRHALRMIARNPAFAAVAIFTLAMGIGANTAIFSVTHAVLLRPLPYPQSHRLVLLGAERKSTGVHDGPLNWPRFSFLEQQNRSFTGMAAYTPEVFNLSGRGEPEQIVAARVSWNFFQVLGVAPALGRTFRAAEDQPGGDSTILITHSFWTRAFGSDPATVGRHVILDGKDFTIIGVLPADFRFGFFDARVEIIAPRVFEFNLITPQQARNGTAFLGGIARLRPGVSVAQAETGLNLLGAAYRRENPKLPDADPSVTVSVRDMRDELIAGIRPAIVILFASVSLVLLIACANVASLLLSRALGRRREIAVRTAIGATRSELIRQLLLESLILALAGGILGTALSAWGTRVLAALAAASLPRAAEIHTDASVLGFTLAVSVAAGLLFGLVPALQISRPNLNTDLRSEGRGATSGRRRNTLRNLLVVSQVALSLVLLLAAGLLVRNFVQIRRTSPGFDTRHLLALRISLPPVRYTGGARMTAFYSQLLDAVRTVPGVLAAAESSALPVNPARFSQALPEGQAMVPLAERPVFHIQTVSPGYAGAMRLPLRDGREFTDADRAGAPRVVMVNETLARRYWPNQNPIGKHVLLGRIVDLCEVVGVLGDVRNLSVAADVQPEIFVPFAQLPWPTMHLLVRAAGDPHSLVSALRARVLAMDRDQPLTSIQTMDEVLDAGAAQPRLTTSLLGALSGTALLLAMVGIYGVIAYSVSERTAELGIRIALGAERADILRLVLRQALLLAAAGILIGLAASLALTRLMGSLLYHVSTTDPLTFAGGSALFLLVALLAAYLPARRATLVDPMIALRIS